MQSILARPKRKITAVLSVFVVVGATALVLAVSSSASTPVVRIKSTPTNYRFSPKKVTVGVGDKVRWTWSGDADHNVTFTKVPSGASKRSSETDDKGDFKRSFKKAGTYKYECTIHDFTGSVVAE